MKLARRLLASFAFLVLASSLASAQRAVFIGENDAVGRTDRDYTGGIRFSIVFDDFSRDLLAGRVFDYVKPGFVNAAAADGAAVRQQLEWVYLGLSIFTPDHVTEQVVRTSSDRPFGGWLYTGVTLAQETARRQLDSFEVLAGVVGPASLAGETQTEFHRLINNGPPVINGFEIHNEPGLVVAWDRRWKFGVEFGDSYGVDIIPTVGVALGNVFTYGTAGAVARFGRGLSTTWGPTLVRPGPSGASFISRDPTAPWWGFDFFAGVEGRAVARNIFLDGNTFQTSPSVTKEPLVLDVFGGAEIFTQSGYRLSFTLLQRSREYATQVKPATFGSITGAFTF
jgi:lipid A 3-O-deacylase